MFCQSTTLDNLVKPRPLTRPRPQDFAWSDSSDLLLGPAVQEKPQILVWGFKSEISILGKILKCVFFLYIRFIIFLKNIFILTSHMAPHWCHKYAPGVSACIHSLHQLRQMRICLLFKLFLNIFILLRLPHSGTGHLRLRRLNGPSK